MGKTFTVLCGFLLSVCMVTGGVGRGSEGQGEGKEGRGREEGEILVLVLFLLVWLRPQIP